MVNIARLKNEVRTAQSSAKMRCLSVLKGGRGLDWSKHEVT